MQKDILTQSVNLLLDKMTCNFLHQTLNDDFFEGRSGVKLELNKGTKFGREPWY